MHVDHRRLPVPGSALLQDALDLRDRPLHVLRSYADTGSVIEINQRVRSDLVIYLEQSQLRRRQPHQRIVHVAGENLPRRPIVQFDDMAFGMLQDFHGLAALPLASSDLREVKGETTRCLSSVCPDPINPKTCCVSALRACTMST